MNGSENGPERDDDTLKPDLATVDERSGSPEVAAPAEAVPEEDMFTALRAQRDALECELAETKDAYLRAMAETDNLRRRAARERQDLVRYAAADPIKDCLSVADNLRRAIDSTDAEAREADPHLASLLSGVEATERQLLNALEKHGITRVDALGKPFDHKVHEAMFEIEDPSQPSGTVLQEMAPGYMLHDRLLRPAMVGVAKGGPAREATSGVVNEECRSESVDPYASPKHSGDPELDTNV